jgi:hypothetical protein
VGHVGTGQTTQPSEPVEVALSTSVGMSKTVDFDMKKNKIKKGKEVLSSSF